jgi:RNA polymerase-binding transcription factor DksA
VKAAAKKAVVKKAAVKKPVAKKAAPRKVAKVAVKKTAPKKTAGKAAPRKVAVKKSAPRKAAVVKKVVPGKGGAKKASPAKVAPKAMVKKAAPTKSGTKPAPVRKVAPKAPAKPVAKAAPVKPTPKAAAPKPAPVNKPATKVVPPTPVAPKAAPVAKPVKKDVKKTETGEGTSVKSAASKPLVTQVVAPNRPQQAPAVKQQRSTLESADKLRYSDLELSEFKELILKKLDEARKDYDLLKQTLANTDNNGTDDTSPSFKMIEDGSETLSREETAQLAGRQEKFIKHLEDALLRIRNKTYGICRVTGRLISKERLRLVPHATLSIEAKQQMGN